MLILAPFSLIGAWFLWLHWITLEIFLFIGQQAENDLQI